VAPKPRPPDLTERPLFAACKQKLTRDAGSNALSVIHKEEEEEEERRGEERQQPTSKAGERGRWHAGPT